MSAPILFAMMHTLEHVDGRTLPPHHRLLMLVLADFADERGKAWPSAVTLSQRTGQSRSTVEVMLVELEEAGWLGAERRGSGHRRLSTVYEVKTEGRAVRSEKARTPRRAVDSTPRETGYTEPRGTPRDGVDTPSVGVCDTPSGGINTPPRGVDPLKTLSGEPLKERSAPVKPAPRAVGKPKQAELGIAEPKPESPLQVLWRVFRDLWSQKYRRKFVANGHDEAALKALAKRGADWCAADGKTAPGDVEALFRWWISKFLADPGRIARPGERGYLEQTFHRAKDLETSLAAYGTPWDQQSRQQASREPAIQRPARELRGVGPADIESPGPPPTAAPVRVDVVGMFGGRR